MHLEHVFDTVPLVNEIRDAIGALARANAHLCPAALTADERRAILAAYVRAQRLAAYGVAAPAEDVDAVGLARTTGTSVSEARATVETAKVLPAAPELDEAMRRGEISASQAVEIAKAEAAAPGTCGELLDVARVESFQVLREKARKMTLEAEQHRGLAERQHEARSARTHTDDLGMVNVHLRLEPHVGTPIVARAETEAQRSLRAAEREGWDEVFGRHLADAYASLLSGRGKGRAKRPELVVLVSHEVAKLGWQDVRDGEVCRIPGVGPVPNLGPRCYGCHRVKTDRDRAAGKLSRAGP
jgi:hypothetical protein